MPEVRLIDESGNLSSAGLLEVRIRTGFGSVCGASRGAASAICRAMGYSSGSVEECGSFKGHLCGSHGLPVAASNLTCPETASELSQCEWEQPSVECLDHSKDSIIQCHADEPPFEGSLQLVDAHGMPSASGLGRLEVLLHRAWSPVCREGFTSGSALGSMQVDGIFSRGC